MTIRPAATATIAAGLLIAGGGLAAPMAAADQPVDPLAAACPGSLYGPVALPAGLVVRSGDASPFTLEGVVELLSAQLEGYGVSDRADPDSALVLFASTEPGSTPAFQNFAMFFGSTEAGGGAEVARGLRTCTYNATLPRGAYPEPAVLEAALSKPMASLAGLILPDVEVTEDARINAHRGVHRWTWDGGDSGDTLLTGIAEYRPNGDWIGVTMTVTIFGPTDTLPELAQ
ncbi:MAG: hypothetical protein AAFQ88_02520 [Pseudomonadota bacterium]